MQTPTPASQAPEQFATAASPVTAAVKADPASVGADSPAAPAAPVEPELSYGAVDAINERHKPAAGLRIRSSL